MCERPGGFCADPVRAAVTLGSDLLHDLFDKGKGIPRKKGETHQLQQRKQKGKTP